MNEPSQGHLVTVPVKALHTQLTHTSFICSHLKKKNKKQNLLTGSSGQTQIPNGDKREKMRQRDGKKKKRKIKARENFQSTDVS